MSLELLPEEQSAFAVFNSAKKAKKNSKKSQSGKALVNVQNGNKIKNGKKAVKTKDHNVSIKKENGKVKSATSIKPQTGMIVMSKKSKSKSKSENVRESEVQLTSEPSKKLSKTEQKKKQRKNSIKELVKDEGAGSDEVESEEAEHEDCSDSATFSDEYTINESCSYPAELSSECEDSEELSAHSEEVLTGNRKRKILPQPQNSKSKKLSIITTNGLSEAKKSKDSVETNITSRKSLPSTNKSDKVPAKETKRRKSLGAFEDMGAKKMSVTTVNVKLEPLSPPHNVTKVNSIDEGKRSFKWLLNPVSVQDFFAKYWEAKACLIKRKQANYFSHLISFEAIDQMLIKNHVEFTKNLDVTSYKNGVRETLNPEGRAMPPVVWDHYGQGCSIRLLNPQTFLPHLYTLNATLQEYFHCLVGANAYLTPPNSQGFAPHYDDIEAFVLQIEGRKRWKLYKPRNSSDILPRDSSHNFTQQEIGKPILEEVLEPGDVLYFPRGTIHQACTEPGYHSLHITLSVYQRQSYADLFEKMLPMMLQKAIATNIDLRRGLPLSTWHNAGIVHSESSTKERADLQKKVTQLMHKCIKSMPLTEIMDAAVDQVAKKFQHEALPPEILPSERLRTVFGSRSRTNERGECICDYDIDERTNVRLLRANILRLVDEEEKIRIYYYLDNSKEYCEYDPNFIEIEALEAASVEVLIKSYPAYIGVSQLPLPSDEQKINLVTALWERGLLMMEKPFK